MSSKARKKGKKAHDISPSASESESEEPTKVVTKNVPEKKTSYSAIDESILLNVLKRKFGHDGEKINTLHN